MKFKFSLATALWIVLMALELWQNRVDLACLAALLVVIDELHTIRKLLAAAPEKGQL
jgi:hypothetical protein